VSSAPAASKRTVCRRWMASFTSFGVAPLTRRCRASVGNIAPTCDRTSQRIEERLRLRSGRVSRTPANAWTGVRAGPLAKQDSAATRTGVTPLGRRRRASEWVRTAAFSTRSVISSNRPNASAWTHWLDRSEAKDSVAFAGRTARPDGEYPTPPPSPAAKPAR
jgi:hypothetical protein